MKQKILGIFLLLFLLCIPLTTYAADIYLEQFLSTGDYSYLKVENNFMTITHSINGQKNQYSYTLTDKQTQQVQEYLEPQIRTEERTKDGIYIDFYDEKKKNNGYKIVITEDNEVITALSLDRSFSDEIVTGDMFFQKLIERKAKELSNPELIPPEYTDYGIKEIVSLVKFYFNLYVNPIIEKIPVGKVAFWGAAALALFIVLKIISKILKFIFSIPGRLNIFRHFRERKDIDTRINQLSKDKNIKNIKRRYDDNYDDDEY